MRSEETTHANPVDFLTPAMMVLIATRSMARRVKRLRPNMTIWDLGAGLVSASRLEMPGSTEFQEWSRLLESLD